MFRALFYRTEVKSYTDNVHASGTKPCLSGREGERGGERGGKGGVGGERDIRYR